MSVLHTGWVQPVCSYFLSGPHVQVDDRDGKEAKVNSGLWVKKEKNLAEEPKEEQPIEGEYDLQLDEELEFDE